MVYAKGSLNQCTVLCIRAPCFIRAVLHQGSTIYYSMAKHRISLLCHLLVLYIVFTCRRYSVESPSVCANSSFHRVPFRTRAWPSSLSSSFGIHLGGVLETLYNGVSSYGTNHSASLPCGSSNSKSIQSEQLIVSDAF